MVWYEIGFSVCFNRMKNEKKFASENKLEEAKKQIVRPEKTNW